MFDIAWSAIAAGLLASFAADRSRAWCKSRIKTKDRLLDSFHDFKSLLKESDPARFWQCYATLVKLASKRAIRQILIAASWLVPFAIVYGIAKVLHDHFLMTDSTNSTWLGITLSNWEWVFMVSAIACSTYLMILRWSFPSRERA